MNMSEILKIVNNIKPIKICTDILIGKVWSHKCNQINAYICCITCDNELEIKTYSFINQFGQVYFLSKEIAKKAIEEFKDDLIRYFTTKE